MATETIKNSKSENIHIRISPNIKEIIDKAIAVSGQTMTDFATRSLLTSANEVLEREYVTTLSNRDRDKLLAMLDADEEPNEALRRAAEIHHQLIIE
jgi:uncharacterized protein (DUF1778 family)